MPAVLQQKKAHIYRILHRDNFPWVLRNGVHCRNSAKQDPRFVNIGSPDLIEKRKTWPVATYPGGTLSDYVPFYFTPYSPMAFNIKTGYNNIKQRKNEEILILYSSLPTLVDQKIAFLFSDRHAILSTARFSSNLADLKWIDWKILQARDFKRDNNDLGKLERYQAEALVHRRLSVASLLGCVCFDDKTLESVSKLIGQAGVSLNLEKQPGWYF